MGPKCEAGEDVQAFHKVVKERLRGSVPLCVGRCFTGGFFGEPAGVNRAGGRLRGGATPRPDSVVVLLKEAGVGCVADKRGAGYAMDMVMNKGEARV